VSAVAEEKEGVGPGASKDSLKIVRCGNGKAEGQLSVGKSGDGLFAVKRATGFKLEGEGPERRKKGGVGVSWGEGLCGNCVGIEWGG